MTEFVLFEVGLKRVAYHDRDIVGFDWHSCMDATHVRLLEIRRADLFLWVPADLLPDPLARLLLVVDVIGGVGNVLLDTIDQNPGRANLAVFTNDPMTGRP